LDYSPKKFLARNRDCVILKKEFIQLLLDVFEAYSLTEERKKAAEEFV
jgi:hypothetical protein